MGASIHAAELRQCLLGNQPPLVVDVRRKAGVHTWKPEAYR